jgi:cholesterol transport system auxiliary component
MAMRAKAATFVLACLVGSLCGSLSGCGGVPAMKYYTLTTTNSPPPAVSVATLPVTIVVAPLRASQLYRDNRLVYATGNEAMGTYEYQRWAQPPPQMIQEVMLRELRASGRYRVVESFGSNSRGNFILRGNLYDFKELSGGALMARVTLSMDLRDTKTGAIVWTYNYAHDQPVAHQDVPSVVAALDQNVQQGISEISSSLNQFLEQYLVSHPPQP